MWYPNPAALRSYQDAQLRMLCACLGVSIALHGLAMLAFPGLRSADHQAAERVLTAMFAVRSDPSESIAPARPPRTPREREVAETRVPQAGPVEPVPLASAEEPATEPNVQAALHSPVATIPAEPGHAEPSAKEPAKPQTETLDASLLEAYRLALIDAAKRYRRYPVQAMERGWEGRVEIRVVVDANGTIKSALVKSSSRYQVLDDQALDMVRRAFNALAQVRPVPRGREFTVDVPVIFELQAG
jgi:periplasmic protein TonB